MAQRQYMQNTVGKVRKRLDDLASKPKLFTLQDLIIQFEKEGEMSAVLEAGHRFADIVAHLKSLEIKVTDDTLRTYPS